MRGSVTEIIQYALAEKEAENHCLLSPIDIGYIDDVQSAFDQLEMVEKKYDYQKLPKDL